MKFNYRFFVLTLLIPKVLFAEPLKIGEKEVSVFSDVKTYLETSHILTRTIDDKFSSEVFENFIEALDFDKLYLTQTDLDSLSKYEMQMDEVVAKGDLVLMSEIYNYFYQRKVERLQWLVSLLRADDFKFDLSKEEQFQNNPRKRERALHDASLNAIWLKKLKLDYLRDKKYFQSIAEYQKHMARVCEGMLKAYEKEGSAEQGFQAFINSYTNSYDPHTHYFSAQDLEAFQSQMSLAMEGIGLMVNLKLGLVTIESTIKGGPADKTGQFKKGQTIVGVAQGEKGPFVSTFGQNFKDILYMIKGPSGTKVRIQFKNPKEETLKEVVVTRAPIQMPSGKVSIQKLEPDKFGITAKNIYLIQIPSFYAKNYDGSGESVSLDVYEALVDLRKSNRPVDGLLIDLRGNGGGSLSETVALSGLFLPPGVNVVSTKGRNGKIDNLNTQQWAWSKNSQMVVQRYFFNSPMGVLVDDLSASASEIFAAAMQDYMRALIIGSKTFGKGTVQTLGGGFKLKYGGLKITTAQFFRPSGLSTQEFGVTPDILLPYLQNIAPEDKYKSTALSKNTIEPDPLYLQGQEREAEFWNRELGQLKRQISLTDKQRFSNLYLVKLNRLRKLYENNSWNLEEKQFDHQYEGIMQKQLEVTNWWRARQGGTTFKDRSEFEAYLDRQSDVDDRQNGHLDPGLVEGVAVFQDVLNARARGLR